jgi:hypothetical protein
MATSNSVAMEDVVEGHANNRIFISELENECSEVPRRVRWASETE